MNKVRREQLRVIAEKLTDIRGDIEALSNEEQDAFDGIPEAIQSSERGEAMEAAIEHMEAAMDGLDEAISGLEEAQA